MNADPELERWRTYWRKDMPIPAGVGEEVKQISQHRQLGLNAEFIVIAILGLIETVWAAASGQAAIRFLAVGVWTSLIITWILRYLNNDKDNWSGAAPNTEAFLELRVRDRRASLRAAKIGCVLYLLEVLIGSVSVHIGITSVIFWIGAAMFAAWIIWRTRTRSAELAYLLEIQNSFKQDVGPDAIRPKRKKRQKGVGLGSLIEPFLLLPSRLEGRLRDNKKLRKT